MKNDEQIKALGRAPSGADQLPQEQKPLPNVGRAERWGSQTETIPEKTVKCNEADFPVPVLRSKETKVGGG